MRAKILLSDSAEVRENLLFLLGGAWVHTGPGPQPFAIAGVVEVDWAEANIRHAVEFIIEDEDGSPLTVPSATGDVPFRITTPFEVGRPPGTPQGAKFNVPVALSIPAIPWVAGRRYVLIVRINGEERDRVSFSVRPEPSPSPTQP
jgi:hypothetical protein